MSGAKIKEIKWFHVLVCLEVLSSGTSFSRLLYQLLRMLAKMNIVTVVFVYAALVLTMAVSISPIKCGPRNLCTCSLDIRNSSYLTMDCSGKGLASLGEICETIENTTCLIVNSNNINDTLRDDSRIDGCKDLQSLSMRNNSITDIEQTVFERLKLLKELDLSRNRLDIFKPERGQLFAILYNLESLLLNGNRINQSDQSQWYPDLSGNERLLTLYIDGLQESNNSAKSFPNISNLTSLSMTGTNGVCDIQKISDIFFQHLINLETLNLSVCDIESIEFNALKSLKNLQRLDLSQNRRLGFEPLYNITYSLQFTSIKFMNYSYVYETFGLGTELRKLDLCFLRNTTLQELALDGNRIELMETNSIQLFPPTLQVLHMNDNKFTFGPYLLQMGCAPNITEFYGSFQNVPHSPFLYRNEENKVSYKPVNLTQCPFIKDTYLRNLSDITENCKFIQRNDKINIYPAFPKHMKKLLFNDCNMKYKLVSVLIVPIHNDVEYIDVSGNVFHIWEGPIGPVPKLKHLDLSRTYCSMIKPKFFEHGKWVENLQIHTNLIGLSLSNKTYEDVFHDLTSLKILNLSMNKITSLHPKSFEGLNNLETLDLSFNTLGNWGLDVETMTNLTHVNLRSNALQSLPMQLTSHLYRTAQRRGETMSIDLRRNPLRYGCQTKQFLTWMVNHKKSFVHFNEYVFFDDDGVKLSSFNIKSKVIDLDKMCKSYTIWIVISVIGVSVGLSVIITGLAYRNRWKLRYFMYMSKQRFYGYVRIPNEEPVENYKYDAFISYAEENIRFVKDHIIPNVETDSVSLCVHQRDFLPGNTIADNIIDAIKSSRKTVVLLTKAFLKRKWCVYEFNMARMESIYSRDGRGFLVIVMLETVPTKDMSTELLEWIKTESYLEYSTDEDGEHLFWNSLLDAINSR